uniref:Putative reverse transcriptase n=1 Tax=Panstrongylus lignarius TaxID=156445 RepID=A0A224XWT9_9HEMI
MTCCPRFIFGIPRDARISHYYTELKWLYPRYRRQYFLATFLYQSIRTQPPSYISQLLSFRSAVHSRNTDPFPPPSTSLPTVNSAFSRSFQIHATNLWNSIRHSPNLYTFKCRYFSLVLSTQSS